MKTIGYILLSYFQQKASFLFWIMIAFLLLILASASAQPYPKLAWFLFLYALMVASALTSHHLKCLLLSNAADLLPNYRRYQLTAAGLFLMLFLAWPILLTYHFGGPLLATVSIYLFFLCIFLWSMFSVGTNMLIANIWFLAVFWLLVDVHRYINFPSKFSLIAYLVKIIGAFLPVYAIAVSILGMVLFAIFYLKISDTQFLNKSDTSGLNHNLCENTGAITYKAIRKAVSRLSEIKGEKLSSDYRLMRLCNIGLFRPSYAANTMPPQIILGSFMIGIYLPIGLFQYIPMSAMVLTIFYLGALSMAVDFFQHRNNMSAIYLQSFLPSRNAYIRVIVLNYFLVLFKQIAVFALILIAIQAVIHPIPWASLTQAFVLGCIINVIFLSVSLLVSDQIKSSNCIPFLIVSMLAMIFFVNIASFCLPIFPWIFIGQCALFSDLLFWLAIRRFAKTEMDFAGLEIPV